MVEFSMLTIRKVPTVVSLHQEDAASGATEAGCGHNCLGNCCLPVSRLPLYSFKRHCKDSGRNGCIDSSEQQPQLSFMSLLLGQWEDRMNRGLFRYDVTTCETKLIPGRHGFIAQLNEGRHLKKRPTEFRIDQVLQPFDHSKFNFTKVGQEEVLFRFGPSYDCQSQFYPTAPVGVESLGSPNVLAINVSPIEYGHVLLIPRVLDCIPQRIDSESFRLAVYMAREAADPFFRVGYNSLGAFATINHLHFQAYYLAHPFPIEKASTQMLSEMTFFQDKGVSVSQLSDYPVRGFVFEGGKSVQDLSNVVASVCICWQNNNIPFNVLISDCGKRIYLLPQCYAEKQALKQVSKEVLDTQVNPAVWEISGHIVLKRREDYDDASEAYAWRLLGEVSLSPEMFEEVKAYLKEAAGTLGINVKESDKDEEQDPVQQCGLSPIGDHPQPPKDCTVMHGLFCVGS